MQLPEGTPLSHGELVIRDCSKLMTVCFRRINGP